MSRYIGRLTLIVASRILNGTEIPLRSQTYRIVLIGQMKSGKWFVIERLHRARHSGVILQATRVGYKII